MNRPPVKEFLIQANKNFWAANEPKSTLELNFIVMAGWIAEYLLELEQKYVPHLFNPEDRTTWPELFTEVLASNGNWQKVLVLRPYCSGCTYAWTNVDENKWWSLNSIKYYWQLPEVPIPEVPKNKNLIPEEE